MAQPVVLREQPGAYELTSHQVAEIRYENITAWGNSRNVYGNVTNTYHVSPPQPLAAPKSTTDTPSTPSDDIKLLMGELEFEQMEDRLATIATAQLDTCQWLFQRKEYRDWQDPDALRTNHGFLWLKGKPGAGKSTLMKSAHREQEHNDLAISFFFNARGTGLQKSRQGMCRSLLHQLLRQRTKQLAALTRQVGHSHHYKLLEGMVKRLPQRRDCSASQDWPIELLEDMLRDLVLAFSPARVADALTGTVDGEASETYRNAMLALAQKHVTCYVDALDECEGDRSGEARDVIELLDSLRTVAVKAGLGLRISLSSRHYPHITFDACQQLIIEGQEGHEKDIAEYIRSKLRLKDCTLADQIELGIQTGASGVFLWVVLVVKIMNDLYDRGKVHLLRQKLAIIPTGLHQLFRTMLQKDTKDGDHLLLVLQWILFAERPLTLEELYHAVTGTLESDNGIEDGEQDIVSKNDMLRFLLDGSKGLAEMTKSDFPTVQFIHESVKDYLLDAGLVALEPSLGTGVVGHCHARLQRCCRYYMERAQIVLSSLLVDVDALQIPTLDETTPEGSLQPAMMLMWDAKDTCLFLEYATECILYHAESAYSPDSPLDDFFAAFPLDLWRRFYNLINPRTRLSVEVSSLYFLILEGAVKLAEAHIKAQRMPLQWSKQVLPEYHRSFLGPAVDNGDTAMAEMLVRHGIGANWPAKRYYTCLSLAVRKGDGRMVQILIDAGATHDLRSDYLRGDAQLGQCLRSTSQEVVVKVLLSDVYTSRWHMDFNGILEDAKDIPDHTVEQVLISRLKASVEIDKVETPGQASPFEPYREFAFLAACICDLSEMIATLAKRGVNLDVFLYGNTGLSIAVERCYVEVVHLLLELGADPNVRDHHGDYPIHVAAQKGHGRILSMLLEFGADASAADRSARRPLHFAARHGQETTVRLLIDHGVDIHALAFPEVTALWEASCHGHLNIVDLLLEAGEPTATNHRVMAADIASRNGFPDVVRRLLRGCAQEPLDGSQLRETPETDDVGTLTVVEELAVSSPGHTHQEDPVWVALPPTRVLVVRRLGSKRRPGDLWRSTVG